MTTEQWLITTGVTWYVSYAVTNTHGPMGIFERLREWRGGRWHGRSKVPKQVTISGTSDDTQVNFGWEYKHDGLLDCIICLSFWVALVVTWLLAGRLMPLESVAVAAVTLWIHAYSNWVHISK